MQLDRPNLDQTKQALEDPPLVWLRGYRSVTTELKARDETSPLGFGFPTLDKRLGRDP
jgi:hypothetical protein